MDNDRNSASDIITYIGVPLAVLGVLPILYNTAVTLAALSRIKRMLRRGQLRALTRSDVVNRVIEVELPRYAVTPLDRFEERGEYWTLSRCPSGIPGGSWTTFNWRANAIGKRTQRVEYADQLRQPQVEVAFCELISYLLDLGAVPDAQGWKLLRTTGLWTPVGCALMMSPDGSQKALTVAPLDDSDGNLSLAVTWSSNWTTRSHTSLPPYWVKVLAPVPAVLNKDEEQPSSSKGNEEVASSSQSHKSDAQTLPVEAPNSTHADSNTRRAIACHVSTNGLISAYPANDDGTITSKDNVSIDHLRISSSSTAGTWFASAATAFGTSVHTILWNYKIPDTVLTFARKESVPCGVLEMLGVVDDAETPEWETKHDYTSEMNEKLDRQTRMATERTRRMMEEQRMPPEERARAVSERVRKEGMEQMQALRDTQKQIHRRKETRTAEALQSPKWHATKVSSYALRWLKAHNHADELSIKEVVGRLLHRMVLQPRYAADVSKMLDRWEVWCDNGGMRKTDFEAVGEGLAVFAEASLLVSVIREAGLEPQAAVALDLQECLRLWPKVRLG